MAAVDQVLENFLDRDYLGDQTGAGAGVGDPGFEVTFQKSGPSAVARVLAEGMMEGVPAVAFATGGIPEMVQEGKTGFLVRPGDLEGLANALRLLIEDPDLRRRMGAAARSRAVELFSMGSYIRRCIGVYDDIWTSRGGRGKSAA